MPKLDSDTLLIVFIALTALAMLMQAVILLAMFLSLRKAARSLNEQIDELRSSVMPVVENTRDLLANMLELFARVGPRIEAVSSDLAEVTDSLRRQSTLFQSSAQEILDRVRGQASRIDGMFSTVLDGVEKAGVFVADVVSRPVRQISAVLASVRAVVESLRTPPAEERPAPAPTTSKDLADKDLFV